MKKFLIVTLTVFLIYFFSWFVVYTQGINKLAIQSEDTVPAIFLPLAIIKEHTLNLDSYYKMMLDKYPHPDDKNYEKGLVPFYLKKVGSHYVSAFPIITPILALPVYFVANLFGVTFNWETLHVLNHLSGTLIMSVAVGLFYLLLSKYLKLSTKNVSLLTLVYSLGTINFALVSQSLWQHGTVQLFLIAALIFFIKFKDAQENDKPKNGDLLLFGLFMSIAVLSRPTAVLIFGLSSLYLIRSATAINFFKKSFYIACGALLPIVFFIWYNAKYYLSIQNQGYTSQLFKNWLGDFPLSFLGVWLSPSKGILVYSPILIFSLIGIWIFYKKKTELKIPMSLLIWVVFLHTLVISFWKHWFGGWSFGYRMSSDILPFLVLLIAPWLQQIRSKTSLKPFLALLTVSFAIELSGIVFFDGVWHAAYDRGFQDTSWLWSVKDSEMAFNTRRILVKLGYLERACPVCEPKR